MHALVREQRYCWDRSALCFYSVALQIALAALTEEKTCHIFSEASLPQQLGDQAAVHACKGLTDKGNGTCQRFWANLRLQTLKRSFARGKMGVCAIKTKTIWLQLQQLALGLTEKHLCVKVVPWQRFLFCNQASRRLERRAHWQRTGGTKANSQASGKNPG